MEANANVWILEPAPAENMTGRAQVFLEKA